MNRAVEECDRYITCHSVKSWRVHAVADINGMDCQDIPESSLCGTPVVITDGTAPFIPFYWGSCKKCSRIVENKQRREP